MKLNLKGQKTEFRTGLECDFLTGTITIGKVKFQIKWAGYKRVWEVGRGVGGSGSGGGLVGNGVLVSVGSGGEGGSGGGLFNFISLYFYSVYKLLF